MRASQTQKAARDDIVQPVHVQVNSAKSYAKSYHRHRQWKLVLLRR